MVVRWKTLWGQRWSLELIAEPKHWFTTSFLQPLPYWVTPQGPENCQLTSSFFVGAQTVVSLLQTTQIKQGVSFIAANKVYTSANKTTIVWIETELFFFLFSFYPGCAGPCIPPVNTVHHGGQMESSVRTKVELKTHRGTLYSTVWWSDGKLCEHWGRADSSAWNPVCSADLHCDDVMTIKVCQILDTRVTIITFWPLSRDVFISLRRLCISTPSSISQINWLDQESAAQK